MDPKQYFEMEMNKAFQKLATDIIPSDEDVKKVNICINKIVKLLQDKSKFKIGQTCIAGSAGKKTTIFSSDVDFILFINDMNPPFKDVLDDLSDILVMTDAFNIRDVHCTPYSIQFKANGFEFDLLPAVNFAPNCHDASADSLSDEQHRRTLDYIKRDPKKFGYSYSGSLSFATVQFMRKQSGFVHEMVRLSRFWYKSLYFKNNISGAKSTIELIAVYTAVNDEKTYGSPSYLRCFVQFLKNVIKFDTLNIVFQNEYRFPEHQVLGDDRPRIMDPVNPYNNFAKNWSKESIDLIQVYANETYSRIEFLANRQQIRLNDVFEPQTGNFSILSGLFPSISSRMHWMSSTVDYTLMPDLKIRNEKFMNDIQCLNGVEILKNYFRLTAFSVMASPNCNVADARRSFENIISSGLDWTVTSDDNHDDYDVTFTVPFSNTKAIRISYRM